MLILTLQLSYYTFTSFESINEFKKNVNKNFNKKSS